MNPSEPLHHLYRFRAPCENTFAELADGQGWYSRYDCLNDPFEGVYINQSDEHIFDRLIESFRVLCFSRTNDSLLLWSHYADNHRGICLEYEFTDNDFRKGCFPVVYSPSQPVLERVERYPADHPVAGAAGTLSINMNNEAKVFLTKSQDWFYEQEYRVIRVAKKLTEVGERQPIPANLTAVYFGLRASQQLVAVVGRLLHDRPAIKFWNARLTPGQFQLQFDPMPRESNLP